MCCLLEEALVRAAVLFACPEHEQQILCWAVTFPSSAPCLWANLTCSVLCLTFKSLMYCTQGPTHNRLHCTAHLVSFWAASLSCWQADPWEQRCTLHLSPLVWGRFTACKWGWVKLYPGEWGGGSELERRAALGAPGCSHWRYQIEMSQIHSASTLSCGPEQELNLPVVQHLANTGTSTRCSWVWAGRETKKLVKVFAQFINTWRELKGKDISRKITTSHQSFECHWKVLSVISRELAPPALDWRKLSVHINITFILLSLLKSLWTSIFCFRHGELYYNFIWRK